MIQAYIRYLLAARDEHALHSPFLYSLYTEVIRADKQTNPHFEAIRTLRHTLRRSKQIIRVTDFGTGSGQYNRSVGSIARRSLKSDSFGRLFYRLVQRFGAQQILDLGTSLGLTTAYLAKASAPAGGQVVTVEGCPETAGVAGGVLRELDCPNVQQVVGELGQTLPAVLATLGRVDFVFFDANHRYAPTIQYFSACLDYSHNDSVFIFDDIHWSADMERAWAQIKAHPSVMVTVDLFSVGLVFFRREQPKQDFILRF